MHARQAALHAVSEGSYLATDIAAAMSPPGRGVRCAPLGFSACLFALAARTASAFVPKELASHAYAAFPRVLPALFR